jgi:hypothetical protein
LCTVKESDLENFMGQTSHSYGLFAVCVILCLERQVELDIFLLQISHS